MTRFLSAENAVASARAAQQTEGLTMSPQHVALALDVARGALSATAAVEAIKSQAIARSRPPAVSVETAGHRRIAAAVR